VSKMNPEKVKEFPAARALLYADGIKKEEMNKPFIAIANSFNEITPGHIHLRELAEEVKKGVREAGGIPLEFNTISLCDGIAMGHEGMKYSLPSRETIADSVEEMVKGSGCFAGVVFIATCDKNLPGMLKACARLDLPSIFVTGGAMQPGHYKGKRIAVKDAFEAKAQLENKKISQEDYEEIVCASCPGAGSCAGLYTANSMAVVTEALGLSLPMCGTSTALSQEKKEIAFESGKLVMKLVEENTKFSDIVDEQSFENALRVDMAIGASTNTMLHIPDIAEEAGYNFDLNRINELSESTPNIVKLNPSSQQYVVDLHEAGGIPAVLAELNKKNLIHNKRCVEGRIFERIETAENKNKDVIRGIEEPYSRHGGIAVMNGNLAEQGAVVKTTGISAEFPKVFEGKAKVFDSEDECNEFLAKGMLEKGTVIVIRFEGKIGGPGMREMLYPTSAVSGLGLDNDVALITDGRFSGATKGASIGHIEPEAARAGNIALVKNGDIIKIDLEKRRIDLLVSEKELNERKSKLKIELKELPRGVLDSFRKRLL
jgi:dihydroxy-acid dehydratase